VAQSKAPMGYGTCFGWSIKQTCGTLSPGTARGKAQCLAMPLADLVIRHAAAPTALSAQSFLDGSASGLFY